MVRIALDAMGGDLGTEAVVHGADLYSSRKESAGVFFVFYGDENKINAEIAKAKNLSKENHEIKHFDKVITGDTKPFHALRSGRGSSMWEAIESVQRQENDAVVSSGNTGAYMALSKVLLKMIDGIERPALVSFFPNEDGGKNVMLDLGANVECETDNLVQFSIMGQAVAKILLKKENPKIGLLNVGAEKLKGKDMLKDAAEILSKMTDLDFYGFVEGNDITKNKVDVIVTDGFTGNVALKAIEGMIMFIGKSLKRAIKESLISKLAVLLGFKIISSIKKTIDPRKYNGAPFVGLKGIAVKSHGNSDHIGFANAISVAADLAKSKFVNQVENKIKLIIEDREQIK